MLGRTPRSAALPAAVTVARAHGGFNVVFGLWPLAHRRSFEAIFGPKADWWLVQTVAGLMVAGGAAMLTAPATDDGLATARRIAMGNAAVFAAIDLVHATRGRIARTYLLDAVTELGWIAAWASIGRARPNR